MRKSKKRWNHITVLAVVLAVLIAFSGIGNAKATGLSEVQKEKKDLEQELSEAQEIIDGLSNSKEDMEETVKELDGKLKNISKQISKLETELSQKQTSVDETKEELLKAQKDRAKQYEDMKLRIQFMYENQTTSAVEMLLSAGSIAEFLNGAEYISQISQYDRNMLVKYEETVENIAKMEETLKTEISELKAMKERVEEEQKSVAALVQEKELKIAATEGELVDAKQLAAAYEAEIQAQEEIIAQIQAAEADRKAKEEAEKNQAQTGGNENNAGESTAGEDGAQAGDNETDTGDNSSENNNSEDSNSEDNNSGDNSSEDNGGKEEPTVSSFTWPCPSSTRVTSDYGPRESPTAGASSYHKGIDIGAAYGADIVAAADGTVVFAGYSNSAGNYVTVSHGGGLYTVYMHCSSLTVSNGQEVSGGQVIAKVGSTGISTGNHLHFGVSLNGAYVNPWNYL